MSERITKLQRWLDLIAYLAGRRIPVAVEELMEKLPAYATRWREGDETARATARRTFERDKDELRRAGIPIATVSFRINYGMEEVQGYRLDRKDFYLPYLKLLESAGGGPGGAERGGGKAGGPGPPRGGLSEGPGIPTLPEIALREEDAAAAFEALDRVASLPAFPYRREARSARSKLDFDLDAAAFRDTPLLHLDRPGAEETRETVRALSDALLARKRVRFRYHGIYRGEPTERDVAPYGLLFHHGHWYLIGHDRTRDDLRTFRVGRMEEVSPNAKAPATPDYEIPDDFRLEALRHREAWELGGEGAPLGARVRFAFPASLWAERNRRGELERTEPDGAAVRRFEVQQVNPFLRWILSLEGDAEILEPPELREGLRALAEEVAAMYGGASAGGASAGGASAGEEGAEEGEE